MSAPTRPPETVTPGMEANLEHARAGGQACPCALAMTCPLHWCPCWRYRMPEACDCDAQA